MNQGQELIMVQQRLNLIEMQMKEALSLLNALVVERNVIGEWMDEESVIRITGLSKSSLYELRRTNKITSSTISGRAKYYKLKDFENILIKNENVK